MGTITGKFHQNSMKTVRGVAETRLCLWTDRRTDEHTDGWTDERMNPLLDLLRLRRGT